MLRIAAEREELDNWEMKKLKTRRVMYEKFDWEAQHDALTKLSKSYHSFALRLIYNWLPAGRRIKQTNQLKDDRCLLHSEINKASLHFLICQHRAIEKCFKDIVGKL